MQLKLKNQFTLQCGGESKTIYNTMLPAARGYFAGGEDFTAYIAVGTGRHGSLSGVSALASLAGVYKAQTSAYNYDPLRGALFIKKYAEIPIGELSGAYISEIGFTKDTSGVPLANYAYLEQGQAVQKQADKKLIITAVLYVNIDLSDKALFVGGENPIIKAALGQCNLAGSEITLALSNCNSPAQNIVRSKVEKINTYPCEVTADVPQGRLSITAELNDADGEELLLMADSVPALRLSAKKCGSVYNYYADVPFTDGTARLSGEFSMPPAIDAGQLSVTQFASGTSDITENPLDMPLSRATKYYSGSGKYFAVHYGDLIKVYKVDDGVIKWLPFDSIAFSFYNVTDISIGAGGDVHFYISSSPYKVIYKEIDGRLKRVTGNIALPDVGERLVSRPGGTYIYRTSEVGTVITTQLIKYTISGQSYSEQVAKTYPDNAKVYFDTLSGGEIVLESDGTMFSTYPEISNAAKAVLASGGVVLLCGNIIFGKTENGAWTAVDIPGGKTRQLSASGIRSIYCHSDARYFAARYSDNSISGWFFDGSDIEGQKLSATKIAGGEIEDVLVCGNGSLLVNVRNKNIKTLFVPMDKMSYIVKTENPVSQNVRLSLSRYTFKQKSAFSCVISA